MDILGKVKDILVDLLDIDTEEITPETYVVRQLGAESIDFLELAVSVNAAFDIDVNDDELFLRNLRLYIRNVLDEKERIAIVGEKFPFLSSNRAKDILSDLDDGPVLQVQDLVAYIQWQTKNKKAA